MYDNQCKIKICGLTKKAETEYLNKNKVDFAGIVLFYEKSKRNVSPDTAKELIGALSDDIKKVAVTVAPTLEQVRQVRRLGFDYIQIHGTLTEDIIEKGGMPILKAFNVNDMDMLDFYSDCHVIKGYVFDAAMPGSGKTFDWNILNKIPRSDKLFVLAGGLNCENVASAIRHVRPDAVDVSSGVEYTDRPGKDPAKIDAFVEKVRNAYAEET